MRKAIEIQENRRDMSICETTPRYDVLLHGVKVQQLFFNMRGYCGRLPTPNGGWVDIGERSIFAFRVEAAKLNREFAAQATEKQQPRASFGVFAR